MLDTPKTMHLEATITLIDVAKTTKDGVGRVHIQETSELTARKGAIRGAMVTGLRGLIFPSSLIVSAAFGGGLRAMIGRICDSGIKGEKQQELSGYISIDSVAVAALAESDSAGRVEQAMWAMDSKLVVQSIDDEALKRLCIEHGASNAQSHKRGNQPPADRSSTGVA